MRLARLDAYNFTVQHQLTNSMSLEMAFVGNNGHGFYANNPDVNVNQPTVVGFGPGGPSKNDRRPYFARYGWTQEFPSSEMTRPVTTTLFRPSWTSDSRAVSSSLPITHGRRT